MGISLAFHIIFAVIGVALPLMMTIAEWRFRATGDAAYLLLTKRWARGTTVLFAVGALIILGWGITQYPFLVRPEITIFNGAAPSNILVSLETVTALGAVILLPSLLILLLIFKRHRKSLASTGGQTT